MAGKRVCGDCRFFRNPEYCPKVKDRDPSARTSDGKFRIIDLECMPDETSTCKIFKPKKGRGKQKEDLTQENAGFYKEGQIFEQVANEKFVVGKTLEKKATVELDGITYFPLIKRPWILATEATPFEGLDNLRRTIKEYLKEHLFLSEPTLYDILTSWIIATWTPELWKSVPYLFFFGPINSGKTRGLEILMHLAYRGMLSSNISPAALYRAIEAWNPTVLLDETEILTKETKAEIFGLLNSGYRKGQ